MTPPTPPLVKLGPLGSHSSAPPQILQSKGLRVNAGHLGREQTTQPAPSILGLAVHALSTASELAASSGIAGSARPAEKDATNADVTASRKVRW